MGINHSLIPALYSAFRRNSLLHLLPEGFAELLEQAYGHNLFKNQQILIQANEIFRKFTDEGIKPLFMKGVSYLMQGLYHDQGERVMTDIDILLAEEDFLRSKEIMREHGYYHPEGATVNDYENHRHQPPFLHPEGAVPVEIHQYLLPPRYSRFLTVTEAFNDCTIVEGDKSLILSLRHQQVLQYFHEAHHSRGGLSSLTTLRGMYDFYLLSRLRRPEANDISGFWAKKYLQYQYAVNEIFNTQMNDFCYQVPSNLQYLKKELFLLDHQWIDGLYTRLVYKPLYFISLAFKGLISVHSRRSLKRKLGGFFKKPS
jgi:hypothetical protein